MNPINKILAIKGLKSIYGYTIEEQYELICRHAIDGNRFTIIYFEEFNTIVIAFSAYSNFNHEISNYVSDVWNGHSVAKPVISLYTMWENVMLNEISKFLRRPASQVILTGFGCGGGAATLLAHDIKNLVHPKMLSVVQVGTPKICDETLYNSIRNIEIVNLDFGYDPLTIFPTHEPFLKRCPNMETMYTKEISQAHRFSNYLVFEQPTVASFVPINFSFKGLSVEGLSIDIHDTVVEIHREHKNGVMWPEIKKKIQKKKVEIAHRIISMTHVERNVMHPLNLKMIIAYNAYVIRQLESVLQK